MKNQYYIAARKVILEESKIQILVDFENKSIFENDKIKEELK